MYVTRTVLLAIVLMIAFVSPTTPGVCQVSSVRDQVLSEYRVAYRDVMNRYGCGCFNVRLEADGGPEMLQVSELVGSMSEKGFIFTNNTRFVRRTSGEVVRTLDPRMEGGNLHYSFALRVGKPKGYSLISLDRAGPKHERDLPIIAMPFSDWTAGRLLVDILSDNDTQVHDVRDMSIDGTPARAVKVTLPASVRGTTKIGPQTKTYFFRIRQGWICIGWRYEPEQDGSYTEAVATYGDEPFLPALKRVEVKVCHASDATQRRHAFKTEVIDFRQDASIEALPFYLSHYGLPEPFGIEWERPTPWWLYAGITAGVVVLLIFLLGIWKRRLLARG